MTLACAAATASTDDSELLELQEAGVMMLTQVARTFAQVKGLRRWMTCSGLSYCTVCVYIEHLFVIAFRCTSRELF